MKQTDSLMATREAQGLQLLVLVRLAYVIAFAPGDLVFVQQGTDLFWWLFVLLSFVGVSLLFIRQLRRRQHVRAIGVAGALFDVLLIGVGVIVWGRFTDAPPAVWASRSLIPMGSMLMILINGLALRPRYPIIVTTGALAIMAASLIVALLDPRTVVCERFMELTPLPQQLSVGLYLGAMLMVAATGAVTVIITALTRRTVRKAVQLERVNASLTESQAELVIEQKIATLTKLAAGVSHELNTPLGAMSSTAQTTSRLTARVREILQQRAPELAASPRLHKALQALEESTRVTRDAGQRIGRVAETLRRFIRLDESERKSVDLPDLVQETLSLLRPQLGQRIKIRTSYGDLPPIECYPRRLGQVFFTIIQNAAESIESRGTISIAATASGDAIEVRIADTGRGIAADRLESLFEIQIDPDASRVHAAMGLPICRSVVRRHGGTISVQSELGIGTTFSIRLPLALPRPDDAPSPGDDAAAEDPRSEPFADPA